MRKCALWASCCCAVVLCPAWRSPPQAPCKGFYKSKVTTRLCRDRLLADIKLFLDVLHKEAWLGWLRVADREVRELRWSLEDLGSLRPSCCTCLAMSRLLLVFSRCASTCTYDGNRFALLRLTDECLCRPMQGLKPAVQLSNSIPPMLMHGSAADWRLLHTCSRP